MEFATPPSTVSSSGTERRVGFELELAGIGRGAVVAEIAGVFGGEVVSEHRFRHRVEGTSVGTFAVEVDARLLADRRYLELLEKMGLDLGASWQASLEDLLERVAETIVPLEISTPPIPLSKLQEMEALRSRLQARSALGTGSALRYAFGLHLNAEVPSMEVESLRRHLQAFLLLYDDLVDEAGVDVSRRATPYIVDFPVAYANLVVDPAYAPDARVFIGDYLHYNPTRNRPLDMLPVLACLDEERVISGIDSPGLLLPRPAFHYRLPDCRIDEPNWSLALEWNRWIEVERLAADATELREGCRERRLEGSWVRGKRRWRRKIGWLA